VGKVLQALTTGDGVEAVVGIRQGLDLDIAEGEADVFLAVDLGKFGRVVGQVDGVTLMPQFGQEREQDAAFRSDVQDSVPALEGGRNLGEAVAGAEKPVELGWLSTLEKLTSAGLGQGKRFDLSLGHYAS
jgi:hypothetical protein